MKKHLQGEIDSKKLKEALSKPIKSPFNIFSMKVTLNLGERVALLRLFDAFKGSITALASILDDVKKVSITSEEWEKAKLVKTKGEDGVETWKWNEIEETEIELSKEGIDYVKAEIKRKSDANEITLGDVSLLSLENKLK